MDKILSKHKFFLIIFMILFLGCLNPIRTNAAQKTGDQVKKLDLTNNILIIGDSRMHQLADSEKKASYVTIWGGHYGYGGNLNIISSANKKTIKAYINEIVKKHGSCKVIIEATINDYDGTGSYKIALKNITNFAKEVADYNKKAVVYTTSLIGRKNGRSVSKFNTELKKQAKKSKRFKYLSITSSKISYQRDKLHYEKETLAYVYNVIKMTSSKNNN